MIGPGRECASYGILPRCGHCGMAIPSEDMTIFWASADGHVSAWHPRCGLRVLFSLRQDVQEALGMGRGDGCSPLPVSAPTPRLSFGTRHNEGD